MAVWGIADLHLSLARPDRRERFAARWRDHVAKLEHHWRGTVAPSDLVLLPGDLSMARNHRDLQADLAWLDRLPGTKVISKGNHDQWWNTIDAIRPLLRPSIRAVAGDAIITQGVLVCGTRGAPVLDVDDEAPERRVTLDEQLISLEGALAAAAQLRRPAMPLYVLWHFPPFDAHRRPGPCVPMFEAADVTACLYGHLHIESQWALAVQGDVNGVHYHCVSADAIGFRPLRVDRRAGDS
jgi:predicted phosphohydrolase